ncbi:MAG: nicotinate-nucleotide adenylyltransferase [Burkholderiales bacterium]|nr:nicotinate-nucleotide adenylyltransferase [Burkholderiales bacterium]
MKKGFNPVGIFGGTFDPIHFGHLRLAQEVAGYCALESVRVVPAGIPPHRNPPHCEASHRFEMVRIAACGNSLLIPDPREIRKGSPCFSVETLLEMRAELGDEQPLCLMLGADAFLGLVRWHRWTELFDLAHVLVAQRPGFDIRSAMTSPLREAYAQRLATGPEVLRQSPCGGIVNVDITLLDISSSMIRECFSRGTSARYLLPDGVLDYIQSHNLYREQHEV